MHFIASMNQRAKKFNFWDLQLAQCSALILGLIIAKLAPQIMVVNIWWFIALFLLCAVRPFYVFYFK